MTTTGYQAKEAKGEGRRVVPSVERGQTNTKPCFVCGEEVLDCPEARGDHWAKHNPSPAQWSKAYEKILAAKERANRKRVEE